MVSLMALLRRVTALSGLKTSMEPLKSPSIVLVQNPDGLGATPLKADRIRSVVLHITFLLA